MITPFSSYELPTNTEYQPTDYPTILAAASFVGLGVITSDVYVGDQEQW
jgi:hypothetical protein